MEMKDSDNTLSRRQEKNILRTANELAREEFANPSREGCPDPKILQLLARRKSSTIESPDLIDHIGTCSPCFVEYSRCRAVHKRNQRLAAYTLTTFAALLMLVASIARGWPPWLDRSAHEIARSTDSPQPSQSALVDLRTRGSSRSPDGPGQTEIPRLPRAKLSLSILLPIGSEEGVYTLDLVDGTGRSVTTGTGSAKRQDFAQVLSLSLDLSSALPGLHELRIRYGQAPWNGYSIQIE